MTEKKDTSPEEYNDEQTGVRLTVERDIPEYPRLTIYPPIREITIDELNEAIPRLLHMADIQQGNPRDTQFKGFAELLAAEIANTDGWLLSDVEKLIARRAYDLVSHTVLNVSISDLDMLSHEESVEHIPDLTEWPKEEEQAQESEQEK